MPSRNESARAQARLQLETPISDDASLPKLREHVADYVREAKHLDPTEPNELISTVLDEVARDYFPHHAILKQRLACTTPKISPNAHKNKRNNDHYYSSQHHPFNIESITVAKR